jgi:hypothetical protein
MNQTGIGGDNTQRDEERVEEEDEVEGEREG